MRALSAAQIAVRAAGVQADSYRVRIKDSGGTFRDLTTYPGFNAVQSFSVTDAVGSPHMEADVELTREFFKLSLSPYMQGSALNRGFSPSTSPVALIAIKREFVIEIAITPVGRAPGAGDWFEVFRGRVDYVNPANNATVRFGGRDLAGRIADQQIKKERVYAFAVVAGVAVPLRPWAPGMTVAVGEYMLPASNGDNDSGADKFFVCDTAGTTANAEPTWSTGANINDGTARWDYVGAPSTAGRPVEQVIQNLLDDNRATGDAAVTLYTPTSPSWAITQYIQSRDRNLQAIRALAQQIGWDCRMKWRSGTSQFELTLYEPERAKVTADYTFARNTYEEPTKLETAIENIRNAWRVTYSDTADLWPDGSAKRKVIEVTDSTSITDYGELWAEISEASNSNVNTVTEATKLANAALSDCSRPTADFVVKTKQAFPWVELGDLYTFSADGRRYDTDLTFAVTGWKLTGEKGKLATEFQMRGKPALSAWSWIAVTTTMPFVMAELQPPPLYTHFPGGKNPKVTTLRVPGGVGIKLSGDTIDSKQRGDTDYEIHVSKLPGFTPDGSTLKGVSKGKLVTVDDLKLGLAYYGKIVPRMRDRSGRLARGQPGAEFTFSPGYVKAGMIDRRAIEGIPNGDFADWYDESPAPEFPPEQWTTGYWGDPGTGFGDEGEWFLEDVNQGRALLFNPSGAVTGQAFSVIFRLPLGAAGFNFSAMTMPSGTLTATFCGLAITVSFFSDAEGNNFLGSTDMLVPWYYTVDVWTQFDWPIIPPAGARYGSVVMQREDASLDYAWAITGLTLTAGVIPCSGTSYLDAGSPWSNGFVSSSDIDPVSYSDLVNVDSFLGSDLTPRVPGLFLINAWAYWADAGGGLDLLERVTQLKLNGTVIANFINGPHIAASGLESNDTLSLVLRLSPGDALTLFVDGTQGGGVNAANITFSMSIIRVAS
jgi:hypothetical protein